MTTAHWRCGLRRAWPGLGVLLALSLASCGKKNVSEPLMPAPTDTLRVLFMGNSLTYANNLPLMVDSLARRSGIS